MNVLFVPYAVAISYQGNYLWQRNHGAYIDKIASLFDEASILCKVAGAAAATAIMYILVSVFSAWGALMTRNTSKPLAGTS